MRWILIVSLCALPFALGACGGGGDTAGDDTAAQPAGGAGSATPALSPEARAALTPDEVIDLLKAGNSRYARGEATRFQTSIEGRKGAGADQPLAVVFACAELGVPPELILDCDPGTIHTNAMAGNVLNDDVTGSLEYACVVAGAKAVVVLGHTGCGTIRTAIDGAEPANLAGLLLRIDPAVESVRGHEGARTSGNPEFVDEVVRQNSYLTRDRILRTSRELQEFERAGDIVIVSAIYHPESGLVTFLR